MKITRREALRAGTAAVAVAAAPVGAALAARDDGDPVVALHKRFKRLIQAFFLSRESDTRADLWAEAMDLREQIIDTRAESVEGLARKLILYEDDWTKRVGYRRDELLSHIVADACCLAGRAS